MGTSTSKVDPETAISLELLPPDALEAMLADDLSRASRIMHRDLPTFFLEEGWLWDIRLQQLRRSPTDGPWLVRAAVLQPDGVVVGHAGFHGPPDASGAVEVGYTIVPDERGKGYSHLVLSALLDEAAATHQVRLVRAAISPDNLPSLKVARAAQFKHVGEQVDEVDGLELIFERHLETDEQAVL